MDLQVTVDTRPAPRRPSSSLDGLRVRPTWLAHFERKVERTPTCWLWTGHVAKSGYGKSNHPFSSQASEWAHRAAYRVFVGPIPDGYELDHLCRVRRCVRPEHLEVVTHGENVRRSLRDQCHRGHPFDARNTYWDRGGTRRNCRACHAERERRRRGPAIKRGRVCKNGHALRPEAVRYRERWSRGVRVVIRECRVCMAARRSRAAKATALAAE